MRQQCAAKKVDGIPRCIRKEIKIFLSSKIISSSKILILSIRQSTKLFKYII